MLQNTEARLILESMKLGTKQLKNSEKMIMSIINEPSPERILNEMKISNDDLQLSIKQIENIIEHSNIKEAAVVLVTADIQDLITEYNAIVVNSNRQITRVQNFLKLNNVPKIYKKQAIDQINQFIDTISRLLKYTQETVLFSRLFDISHARNKNLEKMLIAKKIINNKIVKSLIADNKIFVNLKLEINRRS